VRNLKILIKMNIDINELIDTQNSTWEAQYTDKSHATEFLEKLFQIRDTASKTVQDTVSMQIWLSSLYSYTMGQFELYIRRQFTEVLNTSIFFQSYDSTIIAERLRKVGCAPTIESILVDSSNEWEPGWLISEALPGWHDPEKINQYFRVLFPDFCLYSNEQSERIRVMWQIRHSIVHTGGLVTRFDARKHRLLHRLGDKKLHLSDTSIDSLTFWLNEIVVDSTERLKTKLIEHYVKTDEEETDNELIEKAAGCHSPFYRGGAQLDNAPDESGSGY